MPEKPLETRPDPLSTMEYAGSEIVLGLVSPVGTDLDHVEHVLTDELREAYRYRTEVIRLSEFLKLTYPDTLHSPTEGARLSSYMDAGERARRESGCRDFLALCAIQRIKQLRTERLEPLPEHAFILRSLKTPEEVKRLRSCYGAGFYLIGIHAPEARRLQYLIKQKHIHKGEAEALIRRDQAEDKRDGQQTRDTFHLADVFIQLGDDDALRRAIELIFGNPFRTPTREEHAMFLAYAASLRSADLSRQVGAAILSRRDELIAVGANDVPRAGGGQYDPGHDDRRDYAQGEDPNEVRRNAMVIDLMRRLSSSTVQDDESLLKEGLQKLKGSPILQITEFGRAVHAEMEALLSCARSGVSPRDGTLFSTTFPCHNCAKHIVAAGIRRVVYIEPYPKSQAVDLHGDAITHADSLPEIRDGAPVQSMIDGVRFEPFSGVAPRRYAELFAMVSAAGEKNERKLKMGGKVRRWDPSTASVRYPIVPQSYIERERLAVEELKTVWGARNTGLEVSGGARETEEPGEVGE